MGISLCKFIKVFFSFFHIFNSVPFSNFYEASITRGSLDLVQKTPIATDRRIRIRRRAQAAIEKERKLKSKNIKFERRCRVFTSSLFFDYA
jgi:hypothetical protein